MRQWVARAGVLYGQTEDDARRVLHGGHTARTRSGVLHRRLRRMQEKAMLGTVVRCEQKHAMVLQEEQSQSGASTGKL